MTTKLTCVRSAHNPNQTYEEFKAARLAGWGASDIGSLLNEGDYSCKRRLFLERLGLMPEDKEDRLAFHRERGQFFEAPVAALYASRTGRLIKPIGTGYIKEFPYLRANADRLVWDGAHVDQRGPHTGWGCLEIKVPSQHMFKKIEKEGLPKAYILQLQWQMLCYGTSWGSFAIFNPELFKLEWFDVERDEELIRGLIEEAKIQWEMLETCKAGLTQYQGTKEEWMIWSISLPNPLKDPYSKACAYCPMYETCHGIEFKQGIIIDNEALAPTVSRLVEVRAEKKRLESEEEALKALIEADFASTPCDYMTAGSLKVAVSERSRESISPKVKEILDEKQKLSYIRNSSFNVITIKEK